MRDASVKVANGRCMVAVEVALDWPALEDGDGPGDSGGVKGEAGTHLVV
jgi:hypothetical protein